MAAPAPTNGSYENAVTNGDSAQASGGDAPTATPQPASNIPSSVPGPNSYTDYRGSSYLANARDSLYLANILSGSQSSATNDAGADDYAANAAALAALVEHRNALVLSPAPSDPSTPSSASSTNSVGDSDSDSRGPTTPSSAAIAAVDARARAFAAYKTYLNKLIEARHRLAVLVYERRTRAVLAHNATWTHHIHRAAEAVEVARIGYEAMRVEMEQQGFVIFSSSWRSPSRGAWLITTMT